MKIDVTQTLQDYDGKPLLNGGKPVTLRAVLQDVLNNFKQEEVQTADLKDRCYALTRKLYEGKAIDFTVKEKALIIERAEAVAIVVVMGEIKRIIDPPVPATENGTA